MFFSFLFLVLVLRKSLYYVAQVGLKLVMSLRLVLNSVLLLQLPQYWDYRSTPL
jgi:hypothetical protein